MGFSGEACATLLDAATRRVVSHGEEFEVPFSPELLTTFCVTEPDSLAPGGRWVACCHLLPMVPLGVDDSVAEARLAQLMSEDRRHATVGSRQRRSLMASGGGGSSSSTSTRTHAAASSSSTHAAASSSTRTSASSSGNSRTHAEASGMRRDDHRDWRAGRAQTSDAPGGERSSIERAPQRARYQHHGRPLCVPPGGRHEHAARDHLALARRAGRAWAAEHEDAQAPAALPADGQHAGRAGC